MLNPVFHALFLRGFTHLFPNFTRSFVCQASSPLKGDDWKNLGRAAPFRSHPHARPVPGLSHWQTCSSLAPKNWCFHGQSVVHKRKTWSFAALLVIFHVCKQLSRISSYPSSWLGGVLLVHWGIEWSIGIHLWGRLPPKAAKENQRNSSLGLLWIIRPFFLPIFVGPAPRTRRDTPGWAQPTTRRSRSPVGASMPES